MRVAVSAEGNDLGSQVSSVFGRCQCFVVMELENGEVIDNYFLENSAAEQSSGAGTAAAQLIGDQDVDVLISGSIGPKAFSALRQWGIRVYKGEPGTVKENVDKLDSGGLVEAESPTGSAHMGLDDST